MDNLIKRMRICRQQQFAAWHALNSPPPPPFSTQTLSINLQLPFATIYRFESGAISFACQRVVEMLNYKIKVWHMSIEWRMRGGGGVWMRVKSPLRGEMVVALLHHWKLSNISGLLPVYSLITHSTMRTDVRNCVKLRYFSALIIAFDFLQNPKSMLRWLKCVSVTKWVFTLIEDTKVSCRYKRIF